MLSYYSKYLNLIKPIFCTSNIQLFVTVFSIKIFNAINKKYKYL